MTKRPAPTVIIPALGQGHETNLRQRNHLWPRNFGSSVSCKPLGTVRGRVLPFYFADKETGSSKLNNFLSDIRLGKCQPLNYIKFAWLSALKPYV